MVVVAVKCKRGPSAPAAAKKSKGKSAGRSLTEACQEEGQLEGDAGEGIHSRWCGLLVVAPCFWLGGARARRTNVERCSSNN